MKKIVILSLFLLGLPFIAKGDSSEAKAAGFIKNSYIKAINALSTFTGLEPETVKLGVLIGGAWTFAVCLSLYLDKCAHQRYLALPDDIIIDQKRHELCANEKAYAEYFENLNNSEKLKEIVLKNNFFPAFLRFKSKIIGIITKGIQSINTLQHRLSPSFEGNTANRNIEGINTLTSEIETFNTRLSILKNSINNCIKAHWLEKIFLKIIANRTVAMKDSSIDYAFAYLAEDIIS